MKLLHDCGAAFFQINIKSVHKRRKLFKTHCLNLDLNDQKILIVYISAILAIFQKLADWLDWPCPVGATLHFGP